MVDSEQHYPAGRRLSGADVARLYWAWLNGAWGPLVRVRAGADRVSILLLGVAAVILEVQHPGRYAVAGGALARPGGIFRFGAGPDGASASLTGFQPRLPLWIYKLSHGPIHSWTMARFGHHLAALDSTT
jgi:hypothetical protein